MDTLLNAELENAKQCLLDTYELAAIYGNEELRNTDVFLKLVEDICEIKENSTRRARALEKAKEEQTTLNFDKVYKSELANGHKNFNAKKTSDYKTFKQSLMQMSEMAAPSGNAQEVGSHQRVECDEFVMEGEINVYDPLTKLRMHDPVRNTICGHHYEQATVLEAIMINKGLRCPVAGCGNKQFIDKKHLKPDNALKMRLLKIDELGSQEDF